MEKVLIVDDNETLRFTLTELLEESDFICKAVENGNLALKELTKDQSYGLVILDMRLPGMNGLEILREIKKINKLLPVIMLTAYGEIKCSEMK